MVSLKVPGFRRVAVAAGVCAAVLVGSAAPALAVGGSTPPFIYSSLSVDAAGTFVQGEPFSVLVTGENGTPPDGLNTGEVPYDLNLYLLPAKLGSCPTALQPMINLFKKYPGQVTYVFNAPVPEASVGPGLYGGFTLPLFTASAGKNFTGKLSICGYSDYIGLDAAWYSFGPVTIARRIPASGFASRRVTLGTASGCWPVASTAGQRNQGLTGLAHAARPMVFTYPKAGSHAFSMANVSFPVNAVWIGPAKKVIGHWHSTAKSTKTFKPPSPVSGAVLYPAGWRVPANGATLRIGASCKSKAAL